MCFSAIKNIEISKKQIIKDMMPTCFNVLVYQMDSAQKATTATETSLLGTSPYLEDEQEFDASLVVLQ